MKEINRIRIGLIYALRLEQPPTGRQARICAITSLHVCGYMSYNSELDNEKKDVKMRILCDAMSSEK